MPPKKKAGLVEKPMVEPTTTQLKKLLKVAEADYPSAEDAIEEIARVSWLMYEERAQFVVLGVVVHDQINGDTPGVNIIETEKFVLGPYITQGQAQTAAMKAANDSRTGVASAAWVFPIEHRTPADYYQERKKRFTKKASGPKPWAEMLAEEQDLLRRKNEYYDANPGVIGLPADFDLVHRCYVCGHEIKEEANGEEE